MGGAPSKKSRPSPWKDLRAPARISILGCDDADPRDLPYHIAPYVEVPGDVEVKIHSIGVATETLQRHPLTMVASLLGGAYPPSFVTEVKDIIRTNADGLIFTANCAATEDSWWQTKKEFVQFVLELGDQWRCRPLLVLACYWDDQGAMSIQELEHELRRLLDDHKQGHSRSFAVRKYRTRTDHDYNTGLSWMVDAINKQRKSIPAATEKE